MAKRVSAQERIGERRRMNNGMYATILEVTGKSASNITLFKVQFEDGSIVDDVQYGNFSKGKVAHPNRNMSLYIGERRKMNNGMYATILEMTGKGSRGQTLFKVKFEDGAIADSVQYGNFKRGCVAHPKDKATPAQDRISEHRKMNNGMYATLTEISGKTSNSTALFKVRFEDGTVVDGVDYQRFKRGRVAHPNDKITAQDRIGERKKMNNGLQATILEMTGKGSDAHAMYKVQFEDGTVVDGVRYSHFKGGHVAHPNDKKIPAQNRIGERKKMNNGLYATILEITGKSTNNAALFRIQFEDGTVVDGVTYGRFKSGYVAHPNDKLVPAQERVGECKKMKNGMYATILKMTGRTNHSDALYRVQFKDGETKDGVLYYDFKRGRVTHPKDKKILPQDRIGERKKMNNGMYATIIEITGKNSHRQTLFNVQFEDGAVRDNVAYSNFKEGNVAHPNDRAIPAQNRIGERKKMSNGLYATILEIIGRASNGAGNALYKVQFEDGAIAEGVLYNYFKRGYVPHPNSNASLHVGERRKMNNGMYATILEMTGKVGTSALYKVQFEDGAITDGVFYCSFKKGQVAHPTYRPDAPLGEREIAQALIKAGIPFVWEYTAEWLKDNGRNRSMDFFVPDLNLFIEFHGQQHFEYIPYFHDTGRGGRKGLPAFWEEKAIDDFKWKACHNQGCDVWYFADDEPYTENYRYPVHKLSDLANMLYDRMAG